MTIPFPRTPDEMETEALAQLEGEEAARVAEQEAMNAEAEFHAGLGPDGEA